MMNYFNKILLASLAICLFTACKKDEEFTPTKYAEETLIIPKNLPEHDGFFLALRDMVGIDVTGTQEIAVEFALVQIGESDFSDVGIVKLNNKELSKSSANQYSSDLENLNFNLTPGKQNVWAVSGNSNFIGFNKTLNSKMPAKVELESIPNSISKSSDLQLTLKNYPNHAQSVIWTIKDIDNKELYKETNSAEVTFTSEELSTLTIGQNSLIKIVAYSTELMNHRDKKLLFINEFVETADINIVP